LIGGGCNDAGDLYDANATAFGLADGFTNHYDGYFNHQVYNTAFFAAHGYDVVLQAGTDPNQAVVMETTTTPEPASLMLLGTAAAALGMYARRRRTAKP
jgi:hypothetical protein